jgi:hypothetical protein
MHRRPLCTTSLSRARLAKCRTVYRIYETDRHAYLLIDDSTRTCERAPLYYNAKARCLVRRPADSLSTIEFPVFNPDHDQLSFGLWLAGDEASEVELDAGAAGDASDGE